VLVDQGLELLSEAEAWELLVHGEVGRVGVTMGGVPAIFPVNYTVIDGAIVFRTAPGAKLSAATADNVVAFEVDHHERHGRIGWSVLVVGRCEVVHDLEVTFEVLQAGLEPWVENRTELVRIKPEFISGRRIVHTGHGSGRAFRRDGA
jgi:nitroimidazol reductase NimA-like FMN-containing flavoprotein (pyridoxamine 5'-phosphate oxidase superfamily)